MTNGRFTVKTVADAMRQVSETTAKIADSINTPKLQDSKMKNEILHMTNSDAMTYGERRELAKKRRHTYLDEPAKAPSKEELRLKIIKAPLRYHIKIAAAAYLVHGATVNDVCDMLCVSYQTAYQYKSLVKHDLLRAGITI